MANFKNAIESFTKRISLTALRSSSLQRLLFHEHENRSNTSRPSKQLSTCYPLVFYGEDGDFPILPLAKMYTLARLLIIIKVEVM
jgi:hypothetical protein